MATYKARAVVLKKTKLKETDLILTMLSETGEQIRCVAKGARKPGSTFAARLELFCVADLLLYEGKTLDTATEARMVESNEGCRSDIDHLAYGAVVAEFVEKTALEGQENPIMFPLTVSALKTIGMSQAGTLPYMVSAYLLKAIAYLGYRPAFDECTICGAPVGPDAGGAFSIDAGGRVCAECTAAAEGESMSDGATGDSDRVDGAVASWARVLLGARFADIGPAVEDLGAGSSALAGELLTFCDQWARFHLGIRLKSLDYLSRLHA